MGYTVRETFRLFGTISAAQTEYLLDVEEAAREVVEHEITEIYVGFPEEDFLTTELERFGRKSEIKPLIQAALDTMQQQSKYGRGKLDELHAAALKLEGVLK